MFKGSGPIRFKLGVLWSFIPLRTSHDVVHTPGADEGGCEKSGEERLRCMFVLDKYGAISPELNTSIQAAFVGLLAGAVYGGFLRSRDAYLDFIERNQATAFKSHYDAKKALQDYVTVNFAKGAFSWGWRLALLTGSITLISASISVYRGKTGIIEYAIGGGVSGLLFRMNLGLRGTIVGGVLGSALGTVGGCIIFTVLKVSGLNMEEIRQAQYKMKERRMKPIRDKIKSLYVGDDQLLREHDLKVTETTNLETLQEAPDSKEK